MTPSVAPPLAAAIERHFDQMISQQREKVLSMARRRRPNLTREDLLSAHDIEPLRGWDDFQFEDGVLSGLIQAQISLRAEFLR